MKLNRKSFNQDVDSFNRFLNSLERFLPKFESDKYHFEVIPRGFEVQIDVVFNENDVHMGLGSIRMGINRTAIGLASSYDFACRLEVIWPTKSNQDKYMNRAFSLRDMERTTQPYFVQVQERIKEIYPMFRKRLS